MTLKSRVSYQLSQPDTPRISDILLIENQIPQYSIITWYEFIYVENSLTIYTYIKTCLYGHVNIYTCTQNHKQHINKYMILYGKKCLKVYYKTFKDHNYIKGVEVNMGCKIRICVTFF